MTKCAFCIIWLVTALIYFRLAYDSFNSTKTTLTRFSIENSQNVTIQVGGFDAIATFNKMAETNNKNVSALETSIRDSAKLTLVLNLVSGFLALLGLYTQWKS